MLPVTASVARRLIPMKPTPSTSSFLQLRHFAGRSPRPPEYHVQRHHQDKAIQKQRRESGADKPENQITKDDLNQLYKNAKSREERTRRPISNNPFKKEQMESPTAFFPVTRQNLRSNGPRRKKLKRMTRGRGGWRSAKSGKGLKPWASHHRDLSNPHMKKLWGRIPRWPAIALEGEAMRLRAQLSLAKLRYFIEKGRLDARFPITQRHLLDSGCVKKVGMGVHLYNYNDFPFPYKIEVEVESCDQSSVDMIKAVGGKVVCVFRDRESLRAHLKPYRFEILPEDKVPPRAAVHFLEKQRARGCEVRYLKPMWLIHEKERVKAEMKESLGLMVDSVSKENEGERERREGDDGLIDGANGARGWTNGRGKWRFKGSIDGRSGQKLVQEKREASGVAWGWA